MLTSPMDILGGHPRWTWRLQMHVPDESGTPDKGYKMIQGSLKIAVNVAKCLTYYVTTSCFQSITTCEAWGLPNVLSFSMLSP